ncbi:UDP-N-acetylmuramate dehydrogenase [Psychromonas ingrahamii 37]|uniref:UDP-N-acetylenolpyruvoylglucosamine reductase n=2 Tax=Psychromonas ingrahamii TaxID=357794 RepID=A1SRH0_PSYIN|nr:UDP-N-acetylmuramate dehydrogenase [Psychromonas ingrahamii]ABM02085.1 UDP-N-acetylmuramate dehydrogenase [Psychromonas ingrahamii 37]
MIETNTSLKAFNTFSIDVNAQILFHFNNLKQIPELLDLVKTTRADNKPVLILGGGSNILFCEDFTGLVIKVDLSGVDITESADSYLLKVAAGENWHKLVADCIDKGINGLENLALIPGVVGAAPVQNIGAYGTEFKDFCESVEYLDLNSGALHCLSAKECLFAYRDSIFKTLKMQDALITRVTLKLTKDWQAQNQYGRLKNAAESAQKLSAKQIFTSVCQIRSEKLPDPAKLGNAGSFFKNPLVTAPQAEQLLALYPHMPHYPQPDGQVKLAAGWLIEQANLKGAHIGGAAVHQQQALVLINQNNACAADVIQLANLVRTTVKEKFNINLEHEVRFICAMGESNLTEAVNKCRN